MQFQKIDGLEVKLHDVLTFKRKGEPDTCVRVTAVSSNGEFQGEPISTRNAKAEVEFTQRLGDLCWAKIQEGKRNADNRRAEQ